MLGTRGLVYYISNIHYLVVERFCLNLKAKKQTSLQISIIIKKLAFLTIHPIQHYLVLLHKYNAGILINTLTKTRYFLISWDNSLSLA